MPDDGAGREIAALLVVVLGFPICLALACGVFSVFAQPGTAGGTDAGYRWAFLIVGVGVVGCGWMVHALMGDS